LPGAISLTGSATTDCAQTGPMHEAINAMKKRTRIDIE
jgi:hypothetical protein